MKRQNWVFYWAKQLLKKHHVTDARKVLRSVMERAVIWENRRFDGKLDEYVFNKDGLRENTYFHIWQLEADASKSDNRKRFKDYLKKIEQKLDS